MGAILDLNPSLIGYMGGYGKAIGTIGGSMSQVGQLDIEAKKQKEDERIKNAQLNLMTNADTRAATAVTQGLADKAMAKQDKFDSNVANNSYLYSAMGKAVPGELTNERAQLGLMDPTVTALGIKEGKDKYSGTAGGIIFNTGTGQVAGDYRDQSGKNDPYKGTKSVTSIVNGKLVETVFGDDGKVKFHLTAPGTPTGVYGMQVADSIGDTNTAQRPKITNNTTQEIGGGNVMAKGGMPITFAADPNIAAAQREYAIPIAGGGWYVDKSLIAKYKKQFPR